MTIQQDIAKLVPGQLVTLFEIDSTSIGGSILRFHNGTNGLSQPVVWQGQTYQPFPIEASGFEYSGKGQLPRPVLRVANVNQLLGVLVRQYDDMIGSKFTRRRTLLKYLDAVNFPGGVNPSADPLAALPDDVYYIDRKSIENKVLIEFELAASFDVAGIQLPRRFIIQNICPWLYRGPECGYTGTLYFDALDNQVLTLATDVCGKRLKSCKSRFGEFSELPFGGFPAAGLVQ